MFETVDYQRAKRASATIEDGRLTMDVDDREATVSVRVFEGTPLAKRDPVVKLVIHGDRFETGVELNQGQLDWLVGQLEEAGR